MTEKNSSSPYAPLPAVIKRVVRVSERERLFSLSQPGAPIDFAPGQFFMAGLPGYGEAPFSISSPAGGAGNSIELCIRAVGNLTNAIHRLKEGDTLWIRGPFGRGFPVDAMKGKDMLFIAGGIGIIPMRSLVRTVLDDKRSFGKLTLLYGSKTPYDMLFKDEMQRWKGSGMDVRLTVDYTMPGWTGNVGVITTLMPGVQLNPGRTVAVIIGPPVMYRFVVYGLKDRRIPEGQVYLSLERKMKCGLGKCGHCQINSSYACQEGPVFSLDELERLPEAFS